MSQRFYPIILLIIAGMSQSCQQSTSNPADVEIAAPADTFNYRSEQFADLQILRYQVPGFEMLTAKQKELVYYLSQAALSGRDMIWDQNYKYNLTVRKTLENILRKPKMGKKSEEYTKFLIYAKRVFFSSGIHHHYSSNKIQPEFSKEYFAQLIKESDPMGLPMQNGESQDVFTKRVVDIVCDPTIAPKRVSLDATKDLLKASSTNFYEGVSQAEAEAYYKKMDDPNNETPVMQGLNSKLMKENGKLVEKTWKQGGMYGAAIDKILFWLQKASDVAENAQQKTVIDALIQYYKSGQQSDPHTHRSTT